MEEARNVIAEVFREYGELTGRSYNMVEGYKMEDAEAALFILGSSYDTARMAVDKLREEGKKVGVFTSSVLRPFPKRELYEICKNVKSIIVADRQDSYGAGGGNMTLELKAALQDYKANIEVASLVYGLSGRDFYIEDGIEMLNRAYETAQKGKVEKRFDYFGHYKGESGYKIQRYFDPIIGEKARPGITSVEIDEESGKMKVKGGIVKDSTKMPKRWTAGHGACPGCGIPVNVNMLLRGIEGEVVLLFQTGCGFVVSSPYPKSAFRVTFIHNLFQNGAATLSGLTEMFYEKKKERITTRG